MKNEKIRRYIAEDVTLGINPDFGYGFNFLYGNRRHVLFCSVEGIQNQWFTAVQTVKFEQVEASILENNGQESRLIIERHTLAKALSLFFQSIVRK